MTPSRPCSRRDALRAVAGSGLAALAGTLDLGNRPVAAAPRAGHRVPWHGGRWVLHGANYPWFNYGTDFGANAWGVGGVHTSSAYAADFRNMAAKGVHVVRWWVFTDGRAGITTDRSGTPTGLDRWVFPDLDRALAIAAARCVYLVPVLFDFKLFVRAQTVNGVQLGGRSAWIADPARRTALIDNVVKPVLARYGRHPQVLMWEVMNEPEWAIADLPESDVSPDIEPVTRAQFWAFASRVSRAVHAASAAYVTLGSASLKWHRVWTNAYAAAARLPRLDLDVYQTHYYPWMDPHRWDDHPELGTTWFSPLRQRYDALGLDRPLVVGELPLADRAPLDRLLANGYAGAWPWGYRAGDDFAVDWSAFAGWEAEHARLVRIPC